MIDRLDPPALVFISTEEKRGTGVRVVLVLPNASDSRHRPPAT